MKNKTREFQYIKKLTFGSERHSLNFDSLTDHPTGFTVHLTLHKDHDSSSDTFDEIGFVDFRIGDKSSPPLTSEECRALSTWLLNAASRMDQHYKVYGTGMGFEKDKERNEDEG